MGFLRLSSDGGPWTHSSGGRGDDLAAILTYVDDLITATRGTAAATEIKQRLMSISARPRPGRGNLFLGMTITRDRESRTIKLGARAADGRPARQIRHAGGQAAEHPAQPQHQVDQGGQSPCDL
jgi:hypothetical protein